MSTVIVGGGLIGLMLAERLTREGREVTVVDARHAPGGASEVNAGWVVPALSVPVPGPGAVRQALGWMLRPDSPLYIRPSVEPEFLRFMLHMWRHSTAHAQRLGLEAHLGLMGASMAAFDEYRKQGMEFEMHAAGLLLTFTDPAHLEEQLAYRDVFEAAGLEPRVLRGDEVRMHEPLLSDAVAGGVYFPHERHLDPGALMRALRSAVAARGARMLTGCRVTGADVRGDRVTAVHTADATGAAGGTSLRAETVVLAAGAHTGVLAREFGVRLPVRPGKGYMLQTDPLPLRGATYLGDAKVAVTPFRERLRLAGTMEFGGLDENISPVRSEAVLRAPGRYFRDWTPPATAPAPAAGLRPMTPDGLPVIGRLGGLSNAFVTSGHSMLGVTLGPASAEALAEFMREGAMPDALRPFDPARF
ncbi:NAD(P)/FAD-dependent oxidoreductase [Sediminivirga luteola]|uniref:NAD(P)/FAD-dependent oxidoreductase n=1 Tax=Sediminivirga luteola TaxID=1774748 RepID=UPI001F5A84FB|nr:FAD-dependent oxidoreductase [Sediminivirga luteola]MCI2264328.1 FAD-dependent oxidoreductase [Sediminivirga luteola]